MKTHRFFRGITVCGVDQGVNAADMDPPEVTCLRCIKTHFSPDEFYHQHYARADRGARVFVVKGMTPNPERPWAVQWDGAPA